MHWNDQCSISGGNRVEYQQRHGQLNIFAADNHYINDSSWRADHRRKEYSGQFVLPVCLSPDQFLKCRRLFIVLLKLRFSIHQLHELVR